MISSCKQNFKIDLAKALVKRVQTGSSVTNDSMRDLIYGNFMEPDAEQKIYDEIDNWTKLEKIMNYYLNEYNRMSDTPINLMLFKYSIEHIARISRALQMPQGNVILVGEGGSGRKSSIQIAACMAGAELFKLEVSEQLSLSEWRDDIKNVLMTTGISGKCTIMLYCDSHNSDQQYLDDIVAIMNAYELPNLFQSDEKAKIIDAMQNAARETVEKKLCRICNHQINESYYFRTN